MKKRYFFARLFVRSAKAIAVLMIFIGIGFCVLRYYQATLAVDAIAYKSSPDLQQALDKLKDEFLATEQIVDAFNTGNQSTTPGVQGPRFPLLIETADDLNAIATELSRIDQERQTLKESVVRPFETSVKSIEEKLHAYASALQPLPAPEVATVDDVASVAAPEPPAAGPDDSLFSTKLNSSDTHDRKLSLTERKDFLKTLGAQAENAENRVILGEAADQIERLAKLLPENPAAASRLDSASTAATNQPRSEGDNKGLLSERVARQLERLRAGVRQVLLTSWTLDDAFSQATNLVSAERDKFRTATLAEKGIWLSATAPIVIGLLVTGLAALLILVFADLVQTQLDTATNSGTVADAINALRGSVAHVSDTGPVREPISSESVIKTEYAMPFTVSDDTPIAGGS
ncbi:MAG TPA: hypothetical protein VIU85_06565 [Chthoniobacterales bacterium]